MREEDTPTTTSSIAKPLLTVLAIIVGTLLVILVSVELRAFIRLVPFAIIFIAAGIGIYYVFQQMKRVNELELERLMEDARQREQKRRSRL